MQDFFCSNAEEQLVISHVRVHKFEYTHEDRDKKGFLLPASLRYAK